MLNAKQTAMINHMYTPKFLATLDDRGRPNLVIVTSFEYFRDRLIMGNLFLWKTARNLQQNPQLALLVIDQSLNYFTIEGRFGGFAETGELFDHLNRSDMVRYNAYTGFRSVGTVEMEAVSPVKKLNPAGMLWVYLKGKAVKGKPPRFPRAVAEKFSVLKSIKVAAYYREGRFHLVPLPAVRVSGDYLAAPVALPLGAPYAANVITPQVVSFQVKGTVEQQGLKVNQVYAAGLPVPGKLIYQA
ncbi:MAG: pyridoxamine 5'-phosphate oxidase family protein [Bacillota bacterium]